MEKHSGDIPAIPDVRPRLRCDDEARQVLCDHSRSEGRNPCHTRALRQYCDVCRLGREPSAKDSRTRISLKHGHPARCSTFDDHAHRVGGVTPCH